MRHIFWKVLMVMALVVLLGIASASFAQPRVFLRFTLNPQIYISIPRSPQVTLSVDRGEEANYFVGDPIRISYRTTREGYVNLIDYLPSGDVRVLLRNVSVRGGITGEYSGIVSGPGGTERLVILFTPNPVDGIKLEDFIQAPHQGDRIFGGRYATDRVAFNVVARLESTVLTVEPAVVTIGTSRSLVFTATLQTSSGRPLEGKELLWSVSDGRVASPRTVTDLQGQSRNTFSAPSFAGTVTLEVSFAGDVRLAPASASATIEVGMRPSPVDLTVTPSSFTVDSGGSLRFTALLRDQNGRPIPSQVLRWTASVGDLSSQSTTTDSSGKASVSYYAPSVGEATPVDVSVSFPGTKQFEPASFTVSGEIVPIPSYPLSSTLFYVDFGGDKVRHNGDNLRYKGSLVSGFGLNETSFLEMRERNDMVEFTFSPGGLPVGGCILLWVQGEPGARVQVLLNGKRLGPLAVEEGTLSPEGEKRIIVAQGDFVDGTNRLRIEVGSPARRIRLQKVIVVF
ncbi:MAG: Ig-like domain-containing protein [Candidatus Caldatribacteriaceae bacterium]